jgi:hypothetical protein
MTQTEKSTAGRIGIGLGEDVGITDACFKGS